MQYKITNTTVKPPNINPDTKEDTRSVREKVGSTIQFRDTKGQIRTVTSDRPVIVNEVDGGLMNLQRQGHIKIEPIKDVVTALKQHTLDTNNDKKRQRDAAANVRETNRKASAVEMGLDDHGASKKGGAEYDGAQNPNGDPNFLVKAKHGTGRRRRGQTEGVAE